MKKKPKTKFFNVNFRLANVEAVNAAAVTQMVAAFASLLGVILKSASAELVAYLHKDGYFYPYRQPRGRGKVYQVESNGPHPFQHRGPQALEYFIYIPPGRHMIAVDLTHDRQSLSQITPHWEDLRKLPRSARMWIRLENESEPRWHRVTDVLAETVLPSRVTQSFDCTGRYSQ